MAAFGRNYGQVVQIGPRGMGGNNRTNQTGQTTPTGIADQIKRLEEIPTGYTPIQELAMRNRVRATDTAQTAGGVNRISELMAARGLGGSGAEAGALGGLIRGQNATRQGALSNIDLTNAGLNLSNIYNKAGMLNTMTGLGENARQFDTSFGENQRQFNTQRNDYQAQLQEWLNRLNYGR